MARTPEERRTLAMTALEGLAEGEYLTDISKRLDVPYSSLWDYIEEIDGDSGMYTRARTRGYAKRIEAIEQDGEALVQDVRNGALPDPAQSVAAFRALAEQRKWNAGKFAKGLFGDKTQVEHSGTVKTEPDIDLSKFSGDDLATMRALLEKGKPVAPAND